MKERKKDNIRQKETKMFSKPEKKKKVKESTDLSWLVGNGVSPSPFMDGNLFK